MDKSKTEYLLLDILRGKEKDTLMLNGYSTRSIEDLLSCVKEDLDICEKDDLQILLNGSTVVIGGRSFFDEGTVSNLKDFIDKLTKAGKLDTDFLFRLSKYGYTGEKYTKGEEK